MTTVQMLMIMMMMILAVLFALFLLGVSCDCAKVKVPYIFVRRGDLVVTGYSYYVIFPCGDGQSTESSIEPM